MSDNITTTTLKKITEHNLPDMIRPVIDAMDSNDIHRAIDCSDYDLDLLIFNCMKSGYKECSKILIKALAPYGYKPYTLINRYIMAGNDNTLSAFVYSMDRIDTHVAEIIGRRLLLSNNITAFDQLIKKTNTDIFFKGGIIDGNVWSICEYHMQKIPPSRSNIAQHDILLASYFIRDLKLKPPYTTEQIYRILIDAKLLDGKATYYVKG